MDAETKAKEAQERIDDFEAAATKAKAKIETAPCSSDGKWYCPFDGCKKIYDASEVEERETHTAFHHQILELESRVKRAIDRHKIIDLGWKDDDD